MVLAGAALQRWLYALVEHFICSYQQKHSCFLLLQQIVWHLSFFCKDALLVKETKMFIALVTNYFDTPLYNI